MKSPIHGRQTTCYQQGGGYENPCNDDDLFHEDSLHADDPPRRFQDIGLVRALESEFLQLGDDFRDRHLVKIIQPQPFADLADQRNFIAPEFRDDQFAFGNGDQFVCNHSFSLFRFFFPILRPLDTLCQ